MQFWIWRTLGCGDSSGFFSEVAAVEVCNATVSGKGRRYRKNWETRQSTPSDLDNVFSSSVRAAVHDSLRFARRQTLLYTLIRDDALRVLGTIDDMDLAVFSPPYPNSFDYTDVYNIELWDITIFETFLRQHAIADAHNAQSCSDQA